MSAIHRKVWREGRCRNCGSRDQLDPAHHIPRSLGGKNLAESVIPLCRRCHDAQHRNELELLPLMTRDEQMEAVRIVGIARAYSYLTRGS